MESKRKNIYIVIFVITTIVASCIAIYFGIVGNKEKQELQTKVDELTANIENSNLTKTSELNNNEKNTQNEISTVTSSKSLSTEELVKKFNSLTYDSNKVTAPNVSNGDFNGKIFNRIQRDFRNVCFVSSYYDSGLVEISYGKELLDVTSTSLESNHSYKITGFNKKISDIIVSGQSPNVTFPMAFFLMEDGTISYLNTKQAAETGKFVVSNNLNNLKNIVKLEEVNGYVTGSIAIDINGNSYSLAQQFEKDTAIYN